MPKITYTSRARRVGPSVNIYGIVYGDKKTEYTPFVNDASEKLWRFENNPMIQISDNNLNSLLPNDLVGVFSWKFPHKTGLTKTMVLNKIHRARLSGPDVYNFYKFDKRRLHFMNWSDEGHRGIKGFIQRCCDHVGIQYCNDPTHIIAANQFVAKKHIYVDYINDVIKPCLELLEGPMWEDVKHDAGYTRAVPSIKEQGLYNYIPFILERMMMQYVMHRNLKVVDL